MAATDQGLDVLKKKALSGDAGAMVDLGQHYEHGLGVAVDLAEACRWYKQASDKGDGTGQCDYGTMLIYGRGCQQNQQAARELFEKAAAQKCKYGWYELGVVYEQGLGVKPDYGKAFNYYKRAALAGVHEAMNNLASMKAHGQLEGNWSPIDLYKIAADNGDARAEYNIGMLYYEGNGVEQDDRKAAQWLTKAAEHGDTEAQCNLGVMLATGGQGVPVDGAAAIKWLKKAAASGDELAKDALRRIDGDGK